MFKNIVRESNSEFLALFIELGRWIPVAALVGVLAGSASALLLVSLDVATRMREAYPWLILLLAPVGGAVGLMYQHFGKTVEAGSNLIIDEIHDPKQTIPARMTPLILLGTFLTHLFGGSAGREGTAIQTGASLADQLARPFHLGQSDRRILLMAGISAGFGSVFGTPLAGAVFGIEVLAIGRLSYDALAPCLVAALVGDMVTHAWGVHHTTYTVSATPPMNLQRLLIAMLAGAIFGLCGMAFARCTHWISQTMKRYIPIAPLRPVIGGLIVTSAVFTIGYSHTAKYLGLGIPTIVAAFHDKLPVYDFGGKFLFTTVTLGAGFKGGEVTPLFYIGATLGNALSHLLALPPSLLAGMGFVAVFAGAANTPIASTLMAVELFGSEVGAYACVACVISYLFSGHFGIYQAQRVGSPKHPANAAEEGISLTMVARTRTVVNGSLQSLWRR